MYLLLNKSNVIIDIVENVRYVFRNKNDLVVLCRATQAEGYIGSDDSIYPKAGSQFIPTYDEISSVVQVDEIDDGVSKLAYKYEDGTFIENEDPYPIDQIALSSTVTKTTAQVEYIALMADIDIEDI
ncbi:MAG: hypothetical protein K5900_05985 [Butyrivibrio sp.]|nr:hypothetical protein [Butyrivibrio sp.]